MGSLTGFLHYEANPSGQSNERLHSRLGQVLIHSTDDSLLLPDHGLLQAYCDQPSREVASFRSAIRCQLARCCSGQVGHVNGRELAVIHNLACDRRDERITVI
jgi:hypothetical protein